MPSDPAQLSESEVLDLARRAGLERATTEFPADVLAAAEAAFQAKAACRAATPQPTDEPWPPMRAGSAS